MNAFINVKLRLRTKEKEEKPLSEHLANWYNICIYNTSAVMTLFVIEKF